MRTPTAMTTAEDNRFNEEKQSLCMCILNFDTFLCYILCKTTMWNDRIHGFVENVSTRWWFFILFLYLNTISTNLVPMTELLKEKSKTGSHIVSIHSAGSSLFLYKLKELKWSWSSTNEINLYFQVTFSFPSPLSLLQFPTIVLLTLCL